MGTDKNTNSQSSTGVMEKSKEKVNEPTLFNVVFHNDDYTTMEFVIYVLREVFNKTGKEAQELMLSVHETGKGIAGTYVKEIADLKRAKVIELACKEDAPLTVTVEAN